MICVHTIAVCLVPILHAGVQASIYAYKMTCLRQGVTLLTLVHNCSKTVMHAIFVRHNYVIP